MAHSVESEVKRTGRNFLTAGICLLACSIALAGIPYLSAGGYSEALHGFFIIAAFPLAASAAVFYILIMRNNNPSQVGLVKRVKAMGFGAETKVDADLAAAADCSKLTIGGKYVLRRGIFTSTLICAEDIMWVYEVDVMHSGVVQSITQILLRDGKTLTANSPLGKKAADTMEQLLKKAAPWAIMGESEELERMWKKERADFIAQVDARRAVLASKQGL